MPVRSKSKSSRSTTPTAPRGRSRAGLKGLGRRSGLSQVAPPLRLRRNLGLPRKTFARLFPISERSLADLEAGREPSETVQRRLTEVSRLEDALSEVINHQEIGRWLQTPNDAFEGLKPLEVIERGQIDRIWRMIFYLRSGVAS